MSVLGQHELLLRFASKCADKFTFGHTAGEEGKKGGEVEEKRGADRRGKEEVERMRGEEVF